jgi:prepilin-type processing-associated H-X9-DG protein
MLEWVFVLCGCSTLLGILALAAMSAREAARRSQCSCNFCGIHLALLNYHDTYGSLPPAYIADATGRPMHSWRVLILPFLEQPALYNRYDFIEPWDGPHNIKLLDQMPNIYACPSRSWDPTNLTSYVAITGKGTMFPGSEAVKLADITDRLADTLMVVEVSNVNITWTAPQDLDISTMSLRVNDPERPGISSRHPGGANIALGDGRYCFLREGIPKATLRALVTIAGGEGIKSAEVPQLK